MVSWTLVLTLVTSQGATMTSFPFSGTKQECSDEGKRWSNSMAEMQTNVYKRSWHCFPR